MPRPGMYDLEKDRYWRKMIADWQDSGLSKADFCRSHGIKRENLSNWLKRLKIRDAQSARPRSTPRPARKRGSSRPSSRSGNSSKSLNASDPADFVRVHFEKKVDSVCPATEIPAAIEVLCPSGVLIKIPATLETQQLLSVLTALAESSPHAL